MLKNSAKLKSFHKSLKNFSMFIDEKDRNFFHKIKDWWDPYGSMKTLHYYNDLRIQYIKDSLQQNGKITKQIPPFTGLNFIDIGCGGGLLAEVKLE
jgi:2-polyprenyl-6-hydroxyphenyl methylase/3-demethylubiquinone-9 3-methyltransferase